VQSRMNGFRFRSATRVSIGSVAIALMVGLLILRPSALTQAQAATPILWSTPVLGQLVGETLENNYSFEAIVDQPIAARLQLTGGDLKPLLELRDDQGQLLATGQPSSFGNITFDAVIAPRTATYILRVARTDTASVGDYSLTLVPGFSFLVLKDTMDANSLLRSWDEGNASARVNTEGALRMTLATANQFTWTTAEKLGAFTNVYVESRVQVLAGSYWEYGIVLRNTRINNREAFYVFWVNSNNQWRVIASLPDSVEVVQPWRSSPIKIEGTGVLGVLADGATFAVYFNQRLLGRVEDRRLTEAGTVGLAIGTGQPSTTADSSLGKDPLTVAFDDFVVSVPAMLNGQTLYQLPTQLTNWQRTQESIIDELQSARVIADAGRAAFSLPSAFVSNNSDAGITFVVLAKDQRYRDLIYSADVTWDSNNENVACAMELRAADANNFTIVYIDRLGGYGVRQIDGQDGVVLSHYDVSPAINRANLATNRLTVLALGNGLIVYVNGQLTTVQHVRQREGGVFIAAYNYQPAAHFCRFSNIWVRAFTSDGQ